MPPEDRPPAPMGNIPKSEHLVWSLWAGFGLVMLLAYVWTMVTGDDNLVLAFVGAAFVGSFVMAMSHPGDSMRFTKRPR